MKKYLVSICILTLNQVHITEKCLVSLMKTTFVGNVEIIIVDNGSRDNTKNLLLEFQKKYTRDDINISIILNDENKGCTGGRNQACKIASGEYIVILDNDVEIIQQDWLVKMLNFYDKKSDIGIVGPKMLYPNDPEKIQQIGLGVTKKGKVGYWGQGEDKNNVLFKEVRELQGYPAACWLVKKSFFEKYGYFDDVYYPVNYEDVDFCYRIRARGYKILYYPDVEMFHHEHITTKNTKDLAIRRTTLKNGIVFRKRWRHMFENEDGMVDNDIKWENKL
ncbi:MAG: glycosyltransferase family 2 protein [Sarcina sp.]